MTPRRDRQFRFALFAGIALALFLLPATLLAQGRPPLAFTTRGPVSGAINAAGIHEFLGIPYAAPPVGNLRWRPPVPHDHWFVPLDATHFGNHCPQPATPFGRASVTEDCLFLNVFTPGEDDNRGSIFDTFRHRRPVMVWIHGGALITGESDDYDPTTLVQDGVIVVTINYRLGALGFLAHPALAAESTDPDHDFDTDANSAGNYGLMDQQAALRWVRDNIFFFGGDPFNVTIFGESAGGLSVFSQLVSPSAFGLFHKAIVESGAYNLNTQSLETAEAAGEAFAADAGCASQTAACLRSLPVVDILANEDPTGYTPNLDGEFLPLSLGEALTTSQFHHVPVIQGSNHDEWRLFTATGFDLQGHPIGNDEASYEAALASLVGPIAPLVAAQYPLGSFPSADLAFAAAGTDAVFACPALAADISMSQFVPLSAYEFNDEDAPQLFLPPVTFPYGADHGSELQYLFTLPSAVPHPPFTAQQQQLSTTMQHYWTNFAKFGSPNAPTVPAWQPFNRLALNFQSLVPPTPMVETNFATFHNCAFWAAFLAAQ
jgi:para-nitrobenzyl esterase